MELEELQIIYKRHQKSLRNFANTFQTLRLKKVQTLKNKTLKKLCNQNKLSKLCQINLCVKTKNKKCQKS